MRKTVLAVLLGVSTFSAVAATPATLGKEPRPVATDTRIRTIVYNPNEVVQVRGAFGLTTAIEFADDENIKTLSVGDSVAWQLVPNNNVLFIKPQELKPETNLIVITTRRTYAFNLLGIKTENLADPRLTYRIKFQYPDDEMRRLQMQLAEAERAKAEQFRMASAAVVPQPKQNMPMRAGKSPAEWNFKYSFKGAKVAAPIQMFDDGEFTYIRFANYDNTPAIFLVDSDKKETLVNFRREGEWLVVERIARQFTFRANNNADVACIFNDGFPSRPASMLSDRDGRAPVAESTLAPVSN